MTKVSAPGGTVDSAAQRVTRSRSAVTNTVIDSYTSNDTSTSADENTNFSVSFYQPNDIYQQANRATKYGILFIIVTFVAFFVFEAMKQLRIHAIQYILVGAALAVFYLIVLSLSEHIAFAWAYLIAAATTIGLLWFYIGYVVHSHRVALFFAALLSIFYALMYVILTTEDYALLLGTGLTLSLVAGMMIVTRHINWYAVGDAKD
jgi:inner membrane protein